MIPDPLVPSPARIGIAVVQWQGSYLVGVRGADQVLAGQAEFPGGKCDLGESPRDCAVRECLEETGLPVIAERLLDQVDYRYSHGEVELHFWLCRPQDPTTIALSHLGFRWVPAAGLATLNFPPANRPIIERLARSDT